MARHTPCHLLFIPCEGYRHALTSVAVNKIPINVLLTILVATAVFFSVRRYAPAAWGTNQHVGLVIFAIGFVFWTIARFQLGASLTVTAQARKLITTGLYSRIRNPIYVFGSCCIAGLILMIARPIWLLVFAVVVPLQIWRGRKEAQVLEASFGDEYRRYRASVWF